ncbi:MAG: response regulator [Tagaea sp.]|nr:response regulator [Tagaea sp.]
MTERRLIAIVDDDPALRESLSLLFETNGYVVRTFGSVDEFLSTPSDREPVGIVLDHTLPGRAGVDALATIRAASPVASVIVLTGYGNVPLAVRAMRSGAFEFLEKPVAPGLLLEVVARAASDAEAKENEAAAEAETRARLATLTDRERDVLVPMLEGSTNKSIAARLGISPRTVEIHRARVMEKLGCRGPVELFRRYEGVATRNPTETTK